MVKAVAVFIASWVVVGLILYVCLTNPNPEPTCDWTAQGGCQATTE